MADHTTRTSRASAGGRAIAGLPTGLRTVHDRVGAVRVPRPRARSSASPPTATSSSGCTSGAETREAALDILGDVLRDHALRHAVTAPATGCGRRNGAPMTSRAAFAAPAVKAGILDLVAARRRSRPASRSWSGPTASVRRIVWASAPGRPGWAKLDWLVGDRTRGILANASNVIDPTWEAPDGTIVPLDGFLDPYFQEVYLEAESIPLFTAPREAARRGRGRRLREQLEHEVWKYTVETPTTARPPAGCTTCSGSTAGTPEAAYLRELFDEPVTALYQLAALLQTVADAATVGAEVFDRELLAGPGGPADHVRGRGARGP